MFATDKTVGLAEWIIDDTCLLKVKFHKLYNNINPPGNDRIKISH